MIEPLTIDAVKAHWMSLRFRTLAMALLSRCADMPHDEIMATVSALNTWADEFEAPLVRPAQPLLGSDYG